MSARPPSRGTRANATRWTLAACAAVLAVTAIVQLRHDPSRAGRNIASASERSFAARPGGEGTVAHAAARYPEYRSLGHLVADSSVVVRGEVVRVLPAYREVPPGFSFAKVPRQLRGIAGIVKTDVIVRVYRTLYGPRMPTIRVANLGGTVGGVRVVVEGEPLSQRGRSYVFFLRRFKGSPYGIVGGAQGRYAIRDGRLALVSDDFASSPVPHMLGGLRVRRFERQFDALVRVPSFGVPTSQLPQRQERLGATPRLNKPDVSPDQAPPHPQ